MATRSTQSAKSRQHLRTLGSRKNVEGTKNPREDQESKRSGHAPQPKDTENPPNENLNKDPDEAYGDTQIPHRKHQAR